MQYSKQGYRKPEKLSKEEKNLLLLQHYEKASELYKQGETLETLLRIYQFGLVGFKDYLKKEGLLKPKKKVIADTEAIINLFKEGHSITEIAFTFRLPFLAVQSILKKKKVLKRSSASSDHRTDRRRWGVS